MTREEAIKTLKETYCGNKAFCELFKVDRCLKTDCEIYHAIKALEAEPIKHGRDLIGDTLFECSECGYYNDDTTRGTTRTFNYCPNCGAKMDEVEE